MKDWGGDDVIFVNGRPRHSQSQGLVEQGNATIERHIANKRATLGLTGDYPWASWLPKIQYNMNTEVAGGTNKTPYEVVFGQPPRTNILPEASVENGVINEEDLNFELNPIAEYENEHIAELECRRQETIHNSDGFSTETSEGKHHTSETATDNGGATLVTEIDEDPPRIERPTPKQRRKKPIFSNLVHETKKSDTHMPETTVQTSELKLTDATDLLSAAEELPAKLDAIESDTTVHTTELTDSTIIISATDELSSESEYADNAAAMAKQSVSKTNSTTSDNIDELFLQDPHSKHFIVRREADANYRANVERMKTKYSKRKHVTNIEFIEGNLVTIRVQK